MFTLLLDLIQSSLDCDVDEIHYLALLIVEGQVHALYDKGLVLVLAVLLAVFGS